jgi:superfamily II DNA or RNA helicase
MAAHPAVLPGQLLYVLDVPASRAAEVPIVEIMTRDRKANGDWGKPRTVRLMPADIRSLTDASERHLLERLLGARPYYDYGAEFGELSKFRLQGVLLQEMLPLLCATGRCVARVPGAESTGDQSTTPRATSRFEAWQPKPKKQRLPIVPLTWDAGAPWCFEMAIRSDDPDPGYLLEATLVRGRERMDICHPLLVAADGILITATHAAAATPITAARAAALDHRGAFRWLSALRGAGGTQRIPVDARERLIDTLIAAPPPLAAAPDDLRVEFVDAIPQPCLQVREVPTRVDQLAGVVSFEYDGERVDPGSNTPRIRVAGEPRAVRRDLDLELTLMQTLQRVGFRQEWEFYSGKRLLVIAAHLFPRAVRTLLADGWHVEASGRIYRRPGPMSVSVTSGIDWFDLAGHVDYGGARASLPALLAAVRRGDGFVTLGDGTVGLLPEDWLKQHGTIARLGVADGDVLRFKPSQVALLDALLAAQPAATCDELFSRTRRELTAFDGIRPAEPPAGFSGTLREYQREGLGWLLFLRRFGFGGCLADDMGLGKTIQVLALLQTIRAGERASHPPSLVVVPRSIVFNWQEEAARFTPELRVLDYTGTGREERRGEIDRADVVLTTYGTLRRDIGHFSSLEFEYVVLDEAQAVKNAASASAKAVRLLQSRQRLALSGTPVENHLGELWSLFEFLNPGLLGASSVFEGSGAARTLDDETIRLLARGLRPFIMRRTKAQVAPELPQRTEQSLHCELERSQRTLYEELRQHYRRNLLERLDASGLRRARIQVLDALLRLRQAACHPGLIDPKRRTDASAKLDTLLPQLREVVEEDHKALVFSQFTSFLAILRDRLDAQGFVYEYLDGRTRDRAPRIERFQTDPRCKLFLVSLKAGGLGLNLTAAEYVFLLDPWWNPAVEAQAIDRAHRIGQARQVFAYRLIASDTVEERVLELQQRKRRLADAILAADGSLMSDLRREDLELLLS